jgi:AcrR family transcriptional regulator
MARPKSETKRNAILAAATTVFAERGLGAPTASISAAAGVAEGTLFTYFETKEALLNALYCDIRVGLADAMMAGFPRKKSVRDRLAHVWRQYVDWGVTHPREHAVLKLIEVAGGLTTASKAAGSAPFIEVQNLAEDAVSRRVIRDLPTAFIGAAMSALAETTMRAMREDRRRAELYRRAGFEMLWAGIVRAR